MDKRKGMGALIFSLCIGAFLVYAYLLMLSEWSPIVLQLSVLMAVGGILAWIGYVMATTKPTSATITSADDSST
jgi:predicted DNA-binding transcriptional regulator